MALLKAKQLNIKDVTNAVLSTIASTYDNIFNNLVDGANSFSTGYEFPALVQNIVVTFITDHAATIQWADDPLAISYNVYCHPKGDLLNTIIYYDVPTAFVTITNLLPNTVYEVQVTPNLSFYYY
jgi:hypothetical protein